MTGSLLECNSHAYIQIHSHNQCAGKYNASDRVIQQNESLADAS